jgi:hypothetical protein
MTLPEGLIRCMSLSNTSANFNAWRFMDMRKFVELQIPSTVPNEKTEEWIPKQVGL